MSVVVDESAAGDLYCPRCEGTFPGGRVCPKDGGRLIRLSGQLDPIIGRELEGRFTVIERLGQGGMGAVYRARQHSVDREVAVKVVHGSLTSDPEAIKRFLREAKLTSRLSHPNAVGVLDFGQTADGIFYLVMELVAGMTLDQAIKDEILLAPLRVVRIGTQICDALEAAHSLSIVHRDLKPSNIMLMPGGRDFVKVLDFGLAKLVDVSDSDSSIRGGSVLGTPGYVPPERMMTGESDPRGDLYSLGCTLYLAATGRMPFGAPNPAAAMRTQRAPTPVEGVPIALAMVIDKLIARDPEHRYQSAAEAREALELAGEIITPRQSGALGIPRAQTSEIEPQRIPRPSTNLPVEHVPLPRAATSPPMDAGRLPRASTSPAVVEDSFGSTMGLHRPSRMRGVAIGFAVAGLVLAIGIVAASRGKSEVADPPRPAPAAEALAAPVPESSPTPPPPPIPNPTPIPTPPPIPDPTPPPVVDAVVDPVPAHPVRTTKTSKPTGKPVTPTKVGTKPGKTKLPF